MVQTIEDKVTESVCASEIMDETSSAKIAGVPDYRVLHVCVCVCVCMCVGGVRGGCKIIEDIVLRLTKQI